MSTAVDFVLQLLSTHPQSTALSLSGHGITQQQLEEIAPLLYRFPNLVELDLSNNGIQDVSGLEQLVNLTRLELAGNPLTSLSIFSSLPLLKHISAPFSSESQQDELLARSNNLQSVNGSPVLVSGNGTRTLAKLTPVAPASAPAVVPVPRSAAAPAPAPAPVAAAAPIAPPPAAAASIIIPVNPHPQPDINLVGADLEPVATLFDSIRNLVPADQLNAVNPGDDPFVKRRHADLRLDSFEAGINQVVLTLNETLNRAPYNSSAILRNGQILSAKRELFEICARGLISHARVLQPGLAECLTTLRAAENQVQVKNNDLLHWLDGEFETLVAQARASHDQAQLVQQAADAAARQALSDKSTLIHKYEQESSLLNLQNQKLSHRLDTEREVWSKEKKSLVALIDSLDEEPRLLKASLKLAQDNEAALRTQLEEREKYWMEREQQWELRLKAPQMNYEGLGEVLAQAKAATAPAPAATQPAAQPAVDKPAAAAVPATPASGVPSFDQAIGNAPAAAAVQAIPAAHAQTQPQQSPGIQDITQAFFPQTSPTSSSVHDTSFHKGAPFTTSNASVPNPVPSPHYHPSTTSQALALHHAGGVQTAAQSSHTQAAVPGRAMTLRQTKDLIREIYLSYDLLTKSLVESQNVKMESQKETLLQHMYTFLNHKFGLKTLILDAANSLIRAIHQYPNDHTVAVFGGILRHTLDEDFRHTEEKTKKSVRELLKVYLQAKHPLKRDNAVTAMVEKRAKETLSEEEYTDIISYMFAPVDRVPILTTIRALVQQQNAQEARAYQLALQTNPRASPPPNRGKMSVKYSTFVNILLDFQLHVHRKFLEPFVSQFRLFDTVHSGLLSYEQFVELVKTISPQRKEDEIRALIVQADVFQQQLISFSDCVTVLSEDLKALAIEHHKRQVINQSLAATGNGHATGALPQHPESSYMTPAHGHSGSHDLQQLQTQATIRQPFHVHQQL